MQAFLLQLTVATGLFAAATLRADDLALLTGKWSVKKTNEDGQSYTQTIEVKQGKFVFEMVAANGTVFLRGEGDLKLEKAGPFNSARFSHIRAGDSGSTLEDVDDQYVSIYTLDGDTWTVASNLDKQREQKPSLDVYHRVALPTRRLVIDEIQMTDTPQSATWYLCFEATVEGVTRRYYVENKGYEKSQVTIPLALELPEAKAGEKCSFKLQLDDVDGDACTEDVDNRSTGEFTVSERGSQDYKPGDHWRYTVRWHLK
jgi:hypothetical protein